MVSPGLLVSEFNGRDLHPCSSRALQRGRGGGIFRYITPLLLVPHHGQQPGKVQCDVNVTCISQRKCLLILVPQHVQQPGSIKTTNPCPFKSLQGISCNDKCQSRINPSRQTPFSESLIRQCGIMRRYKQT